MLFARFHFKTYNSIHYEIIIQSAVLVLMLIAWLCVLCECEGDSYIV